MGIVPEDFSVAEIFFDSFSLVRSDRFPLFFIVFWKNAVPIDSFFQSFLKTSKFFRRKTL